MGKKKIFQTIKALSHTIFLLNAWPSVYIGAFDVTIVLLGWLREKNGNPQLIFQKLAILLQSGCFLKRFYLF